MMIGFMAHGISALDNGGGRRGGGHVLLGGLGLGGNGEIIHATMEIFFFCLRYIFGMVLVHLLPTSQLRMLSACAS